MQKNHAAFDSNKTLGIFHFGVDLGSDPVRYGRIDRG